MRDLILYLVNEWVRVLVEFEDARYVDDTLAVREVVGVLGKVLHGPTTQVVVDRRLRDGSVTSHLVALPEEVLTAEHQLNAELGQRRKAAAQFVAERRREILTEVTQRAKAAPRAWGWVYWSAPRSIRRWADQQCQATEAEPRVYAYLACREAALAELEQVELSADDRALLYAIGGINAPPEIDHREEPSRGFDGPTTFSAKAVTTENGRLRRKVNKKRAPDRRAQEIEKAERRLAQAESYEERTRARKALWALTTTFRPKFWYTKDGHLDHSASVDDEGTIRPSARGTPRPKDRTNLNPAERKALARRQALHLLDLTVEVSSPLDLSYLNRLVSTPNMVLARQLAA